LQRIPEPDREDFIRAWDKGRHKEAYEVLDRPVFAENVAKSGGAVKSELATVKAEAVSKTVESLRTSEGSEQTPAPERLAKELSLGEVRLVDSGDSEARVPNVSGGKSVEITR